MEDPNAVLSKGRQEPKRRVKEGEETQHAD
jgi:hypothetical protein